MDKDEGGSEASLPIGKQRSKEDDDVVDVPSRIK